MSEVVCLSHQQLHHRALWIEWFVVAYNLLEAGIALAAGAVAGSTALTSFGFDSAIEIGAASIVLWRLCAAGPDASRQRQAQVEKRALYFIAGTFVLLSGYIIFESIGAIMQREGAENSVIGLALAALSTIVMPIAGWLKYRTGSAMGSEALKADAIESFICAYLSVALLAGVGLNFAFGWWGSDSATALAMLPVILWQAWHTFGEAEEAEANDSRSVSLY